MSFAIAARSLALSGLAMLTIAAAEPAAVPGVNPAVVARFVEHMRNNITLGSYPDGRPLEVETPAERARPILPERVSQRVWQRGSLDAVVEACGGDWKAMGLDPLMQQLRARGDLDDRQLGFAKLLHDAAKEQSGSITEEDCTDGVKANVANALKELAETEI